jgi:hypothetical protein
MAAQGLSIRLMGLTCCADQGRSAGAGSAIEPIKVGDPKPSPSLSDHRRGAETAWREIRHPHGIIAISKNGSHHVDAVIGPN